MKKPWDSIVDDVQGYLSEGVSVLPAIEFQFLEALYQREQVQGDLCLLPSSRFRLFHLRVEHKIRTRYQYRNVA